MPVNFEVSLAPQVTANSQKLAVTAATVHSTAFVSSSGSNTYVVVTVNTDCYMRMSGVNNTVIAADGTDQRLVSGHQYRVGPIPDGYYLHFIQDTAGGSAYITPGG